MAARVTILFGGDTVRKDAYLKRALKDTGASAVFTFGEAGAVGIDDAREIKRKASLGGSMAFVIREADRMTPEAYEALLKVLEEVPVSHYFFLDARSSNIPATIISRAARVPFFADEDIENINNFFAQEIATIYESFTAHIKKNGFVPRSLYYDLASLLRISILESTSRVPLRYLEDLYGSTRSTNTA